MDLIPINITGAKITSVDIAFPDVDNETPRFEAKVSLIDDCGKRITSIGIGNRWSSGDDIETSHRACALIGKLKNELDTIITVYMNKQRKLIEVDDKEAINV